MFSNAVLLSVVQERLVCQFGELHECIEFLAGGPVFTHQLPAWWDENRKALERAYPDLASYDESGLSRETHAQWCAERRAFLDEEREAFPIGGAPESPFDHLPEGKPVIVVQVSEPHP
jgi:hypothetical protein